MHQDECIVLRMRISIKNMVCNRCILVVSQQLEKLNIPVHHINLGKIETHTELSKDTLSQFSANLSALGFELLDDNKTQLIEKIKNIVRDQVHYTDKERAHNYSEILTKTLHKDYSYLSNLFSEVEGVTIEKYNINQKIEKVKELIIYDQLSLSEIAYKIDYSSVAHLSNHKKVTGLTPTHFKQVGQYKRKPLDKI